MLKAFKYRIYPSVTQKEAIDQTINACRLVYNLALETKTYAGNIFAAPIVPAGENIKSIWTTANNVGFEVFKHWMHDNYSLTKR